MDEAMKDCDNDLQQRGASYKYPLSPLTSDIDGLCVPFTPLRGESVSLLGVSADGLLALTNYRLYIENLGVVYNIPLGLIDICEVRDIFYLHIQCKEARTVRCTFSTNEQCMEWFKRLNRVTQTPSSLHDLFAFAFYAWTTEIGDVDIISRLKGEIPLTCEQLFKKEVERLRFDTHGAWRITQANSNYRLCPSYPPLLLVPACITDETLEMVARFRSSRRIPVIVWRHTGNGAVIARCSQPEVGWLGWRSGEDEDLLKAMADACTFDRGAQSMLDVHLSLDSSPHSLTSNIEDNLSPLNTITTNHSNTTTSSSPTTTTTSGTLSEGKKVLIMDARSYTTAVANRARGGGCECPEYYPSCDIEFMNLANIHSIRKSFQAMRQLCASPADQPNWFSLLEGTRWLHHMSGLMRAASVLASAIEREGRPVLVHCSDGWDRTPQIVALGQLLLDPYYRTIEGFRVLCEREWLDFGHKFADRCGHAVGQDDPNERCPVFLQWLDCVHQLLHQFPCSFEFSQTYLVKLAKHTYSNLFGTFLCNSRQEREKNQIYTSTFGVWPFLTDINFRNHLYSPVVNENEQVLWPSYNIRDLHLWSEMYLGSLEIDTSLESGGAANSSVKNQSGSNSNGHGQQNGHQNGGTHNTGFVNIRESSVSSDISISMTKTRSFNDLQNMAADIIYNTPRRSSDPNILTDSIKLETLSLCDDNSDDKTPDLESVEDDTEINHTHVEEHDETGSVLNNHHEILNNIVNGDEKLNVKQINHDDDEKPNLENRHEINFLSNGINKNYSTTAHDLIEFTNMTPMVDVIDGRRQSFKESSSSSSVITNGLVNGTTSSAAVDTSTETIIPDQYFNGTQPTTNITTGSEPNNDETIRNSPSALGDGVTTTSCKVCSQRRRYIADKYARKKKSTMNNGRYSSISSPSHTCTPPLPPGVAGPTPPISQTNNKHCDLDGLTPLQSSIQNRLRQIVSDHKAKEDALERELHTTRMALIQQVCHHCTNDGSDAHDETCSVGGSVCSTGEGRMSANESLPSDISWETLDEPSHLPDSIISAPTLWVPDHAVSRCTGCQTEFWLGRRKHHCRNCGRIFCADCSENSAPLPNEQLYNPVRMIE
ncbi:myotubularin-related protein 4 isoform X2 [Chrysoperla carnea]|uniref:myotubularin-related protein 4 isoform X2 n=1 Tax=Chrysoperla carnea TaxID=189513 RepID=UPI001D07AE95|nr:myotubularin-related protein 4 isoform X2 [Chrysoperla carnea]